MRLSPISALVMLLALTAGIALQSGNANAEQMGRQPWRFKVIGNPLSLNLAITIEQKEEGGFGTRVNSSTLITSSSTTHNSTSAENFTEILSNCGNDASCAVDATLMREGTGGTQTSSTTDGAEPTTQSTSP